MFSCFEKMSGINSTPIFRLFEVRKGELLYAGSSAIRMFAAETLPLKMDKLKSPTSTFRPNAVLSSDSIFGRKLFTLINKGSKRRSTTNRCYYDSDIPMNLLHNIPSSI